MSNFAARKVLVAGETAKGEAMDYYDYLAGF